MSGRKPRFNIVELIAIAIGSILLSAMPFATALAAASSDASTSPVETTSTTSRISMSENADCDLWEDIWELLSRVLPKFPVVELPLYHPAEIPAIFDPGTGNHHFDHTTVF